ncbi:MAG: glycosyltransferase [Ignavibacteriaceae bacterium]|nr:glycosyltransferase [Ignavibacteriaceae bacterium]
MYEFLRNIKSIITRRKSISSFDKFCINKCDKRALLSYLVHPFLLPQKFWEEILFSNRGMAIHIVKALNELGYKVDIIDFENSNWQPKHNYDLFIGHGGKNYQHLIENKLSVQKSIYFSTGPYWKFFNQNEAKRFYEFTIRTGYILPPDRYIKYDEEFANTSANGIICLGSSKILDTYKKFKNVICINNGHFPAKNYNNLNKDYNSGRNHFLFFSGRGNIHKGLDLLIEAFRGSKSHLHICQWIEPEFERIYFNDLHNQPNIHFEGFVKMRSTKFFELVNKCNWVILPTCAEGQPGSVIECMAYGLIPILSEYANIDIEEFGILIENLDVRSVQKVIITAEAMDSQECRRRSDRIREITANDYSSEKFKENFKSAVIKIVGSDV